MLAQEEARLLNHNYIGTEHILLGLLHEGHGVAAKALESLGISLEKVRLQVEEMVGAAAPRVGGHIPFTPRAKKVLELSLREALALGHNYIGTEHILLGLLAEGEGVAAQALVKLGAGLSRVREQVIQLLSGYSGSKEFPGGGGDLAYAAYARSAWATGTASGEAPAPPLCPMCGGGLGEHLQVAVIEVTGEQDAGEQGGGEHDAREVPVPFCGRCGHAV